MTVSRVSVLDRRTWVGRYWGASDQVHFGTPAALQNMTKGTTLALVYMSAFPAVDAYIWSRAESGAVYNVFRFTGSVLRRRVQASATALDMQVAYANIPYFGLNKWCMVGCTWDLAGPLSNNVVYGGDVNNLMMPVTTYATRNAGAGAITSDAALNFRLFARGGASNGLTGVGHTVFITANHVASISEMQSMGLAMIQQLPMHGFAPTGWWRSVFDGCATVQNLAGNGLTGTITGSTVGIAPPLLYKSPSFFTNALGSLVGTIYTVVVGGLITPVGTLSKKTKKIFSGSVTPVGTLTKLTSKLLDGTITPVGTLVKKVAMILTGSITPVGSLTKVTKKIFSGIITPVGSLTKLTKKIFSGIITPVGTLAAARRLLKTLSGTITPTGSLSTLIIPPIVGVYNSIKQFWLRRRYH